MEFQILSIIELVYGELQSNESFLITKENEKEQVEKAENLFVQKIKEIEETTVLLNSQISKENINHNDSNYDYYIESGSYIKGDYQLLLTWSTTVHV